MRNVKWLKKTAAMLLAGTLMCGTAAWTGAGLVQEVKAGEQQTEPPVIAPDQKGTLNITKTDGSQAPLSGAGFTLYKVMSLDYNKEKKTYTYTPEAPFAEVLTESGVNADELGNYSAQAIEALAAKLAAVDGKEAAKVGPEQTTGVDGIAQFTNLGLGYYLVEETTVPDKYIAGNPFLVAFPTTSKDGTGWEYTVNAKPKNYSTSIGKEINKDEVKEGVSKDGTVTVGDYVPYKITTQTPNYADDVYTQDVKFTITDVMSDGLKAINDKDYPVVVTVGGIKLTEDTEYTVTVAEVTDGAPDLTIAFKSKFLKSEEGSNQPVVITYFAQVTDKAVAGMNGNTNTPNLEYSNKPGEEDGHATGPDVKVYTFDMKVVKFTNEDGENARALTGAEFELRKGSPEGTSLGKQEIIDENGTISFGKLDAGLYYLVETKAPAGYTLLANPIKVEIRAQETEGIANGEFELFINDTKINAAEGTFVSYANQASGTSQVAVENHKGFTLPTTGGMGIMLFLAVGVAGIVIVSVLLTRKSKDAK